MYPGIRPLRVTQHEKQDQNEDGHDGNDPRGVDQAFDHAGSVRFGAATRIVLLRSRSHSWNRTPNEFALAYGAAPNSEPRPPAGTCTWAYAEKCVPNQRFTSNTPV